MTAKHGENADVSRFFSSFANDWDSLYDGRRGAFWRFIDREFRRDIYDRYLLTFERLGVDLTGKTVLDVGCGSGVYCAEAARLGATRVVGIDGAPKMVELATARCREAARGTTCAFRVTGFPPDDPVDLLQMEYDYAIVMGVM